MSQRFYLLFLPLIITLTHSYSQSGKLDTTFGNQGIVITDIDSSDHMHAMVIQPDQKILVAGTTRGIPGIGFIEDIAIVRYMPDGSLDPDFGDGGIARIYYNLEYYRCHAMAIQPDGRIVLAGFTSYQSEITFDPVEDFALFRLNSNGSLDSTFGIAGLVITDLGMDLEERANEVLIQDDGKIIAAGLSHDGSLGSGFIMIRYESNGDIDLNFGNDGIVRTSIQQYAEVTTGVIQPDGKIILAGYALTGFPRDFAMVRYLENGSQDSLFGADGIVQTDLEGNGLSDFVTTMLLESDGKIVLGGYANFSYTPYEADIGVVRYNSDGSLDKSFGNNGIDVIYLGSRSQNQAMARQPDGKYVLTGSSNVIDSVQQWLLARLEHNGELDTTFGTQGIILTDIEGEQELSLKVLIQNDGRIVVGGTNNGGFEYEDFVLARYIADKQTGIQIVNPLAVSISPNPCTDFISIDIGDQSGSFNGIISDLSGRVIRNETLYQGSDGKLLIDTRLLNSGFYLLGITNNVKSSVVSFVVEK